MEAVNDVVDEAAKGDEEPNVEVEFVDSSAEFEERRDDKDLAVLVWTGVGAASAVKTPVLRPESELLLSLKPGKSDNEVYSIVSQNDYCPTLE